MFTYSIHYIMHTNGTSLVDIHVFLVVLIILTDAKFPTLKLEIVAKRRPLACQAVVLTIRLSGSLGIATVKTGCNWDRGDTIAQLVTRGRLSRSITLS